MQRPGYRRRPAPLPSPQPIPDRPQQDLPEVTRSAAVVIAAAPLDVPEEADPESPDAAPPPLAHPKAQQQSQPPHFGSPQADPVADGRGWVEVRVVAPVAGALHSAQTFG